MIHLFNKVYLSLDDFIQPDLDRVVIGRSGNQMLQDLQTVLKGTLLKYSLTFPANFSDLIVDIKTHVDTSNKKLIVYADKENFNKFLVSWIKTILPNIDLNTFNKILQLTVYKERIVNNTQLKPNHLTTADQLWAGLGNLDSLFNSISITSIERNKIKDLNLNYSYELLLSDYFSGSSNYTAKLNTTLHMFLRRWMKEAFTDNREMILLNLLNKNFQTSLNFTENDIDLNSNNPIANISSLQYYADDTIWEQKNSYGSGVYGICKIENLSQEKITGLRDLIKNVYKDVEGMETNRTMFSAFNYLELAAKDTITNAEMNTVLDFVVATPFDTCLVPKFDFQNINYVLIQHIFNLKRTNNTEALSKYQLL
jgi:hypothetical protein